MSDHCGISLPASACLHQPADPSKHPLKPRHARRDLFKSLDTDGSNTIEASELADGLKAQGYNISQQELGQLMGRVDFDRNGTLDIEEFISGLIDWTEVCRTERKKEKKKRKEK